MVYCNYIYILYAMLPDLQVVIFFVRFVIKISQKIFICCLIVGYTTIYRTTIILNALKKIVNYIKLTVVDGWLT